MIVASGPMLPALKQATSTIPVVMAGGEDPVGQGLRPEPRAPGRELHGAEHSVGRHEREAPRVAQGARPRRRVSGGSLGFDQPPELAGGRSCRPRAGVEAAVARDSRCGRASKRPSRAATGARAGALLVFAGGLLYPQTRRVAELAAKSRLPAMYAFRPQVEAGGLISYGADINDIWRRAAVFVDKILKGAKPADLPVEQPSKFELVINLKTARSLGLTIPQSLLLRADTVIQ